MLRLRSRPFWLSISADGSQSERGLFVRAGSACAGRNPAAVFEANGLINIHPVQQVVSGNVRDVEFALTDNAYGSRIIAGQPVPANRPKLKFRTTTLDALVGSYPPPDFIKMDVEGEELSVLQGGEEVLIRANRTIFIIELHSTQLAKDCIEFLRSHGYRVTELDGSPIREHEAVHPGDLQVMAFPSERWPS